MNRFEFVMPKFSWEKPIEEEILNFCMHMASEMERVADKNKETGWFANNSFSEKAEAMANAYRTVGEHVLREIKIRQTVGVSKVDSGIKEDVIENEANPKTTE